MTIYYIPSKGPISWKELLPDPEKHWKSGYSAKALADCWEAAQGFPDIVLSVLKDSEYELFHFIEFLLGIPEHQVSLPGGSTASQNDIFVLAKSKDQLISIAVEGKFSEPFGPLVSEWVEQATGGKMKRLEFLIELLEINNKDISQIRYQLLHRTASALLEAERFCAPNALMLVHSFSQSHEWFEDYAAFVGLYGIEAEINKVHHVGEVNDKELYLAWVVGEPMM